LPKLHGKQLPVAMPKLFGRSMRELSKRWNNLSNHLPELYGRHVSKDLPDCM
jgi:hypothetical protein